jgi:hypothetical protein
MKVVFIYLLYCIDGVDGVATNSAHSAKVWSELFPTLNGLVATTSQEFCSGELLKTIPGPFVMANPPPVTNSSESHVAILCAIPLKGTISPSSNLTVRFIVGAALPGGPIGPCSP